MSLPLSGPAGGTRVLYPRRTRRDESPAFIPIQLPELVLQETKGSFEDLNRISVSDVTDHLLFAW